MVRSTNAPPLWLLRIFSLLHALAYRMSGGRLGRTMNGMPVLLLTTTGRRTGKHRTVPVVYLRDGDNYIVAPGVLERPAWLLNLRAHPTARIQVGASRIQVRALEANQEQRRRLWARVPSYWQAYQKAAKNELPLIFLMEIE